MAGRIHKAILSTVSGVSIFGILVPTALGADVPSRLHTTTVIWNQRELSSVKYTVEADAAHRATSWMMPNDVIQVLHGLGITSDWDGQTLNIHLPDGWIVPATLRDIARPPSEKHAVITLNGEQVAWIPALNQAVPNRGIQLTALPLYNVMQVLADLGFKSKWLGNKWILTGKFTNPGASVQIPTEYSHRTTLQLQNDTSFEDELPPPPVPNAPATSVTLPVYPGAKTMSGSMKDAFKTVSMEDYQQTGGILYQVPGSETAAEQWSKTAFEKTGYKLFGEGQAGNMKTGQHVDALIFTSTTSPNVNVYVTFQPINSTTALVYDWVDATVVPPRPASTQIPSDVIQADLTETTMMNGTSTKKESEITDAGAIQSLGQALNNLKVINPPGISSEPSSTDWSNGTMVLTRSDGEKITVQVAPSEGIEGGVLIGSLPLLDPSNSVWNLFQKDISLFSNGNS